MKHNFKKLEIWKRSRTLVKEIYLEGFRNLGHIIIEKYFKIFAWFSFVMFFIVLYAFVYRIATGYAFN